MIATQRRWAAHQTLRGLGLKHFSAVVLESSHWKRWLATYLVNGAMLGNRRKRLRFTKIAVGRILWGLAVGH